MNSLEFIAFTNSHGDLGPTVPLLPGAIQALPWTARQWRGAAANHITRLIMQLDSWDGEGLPEKRHPFCSLSSAIPYTRSLVRQVLLASWLEWLTPARSERAQPRRCLRFAASPAGQSSCLMFNQQSVSVLVFLHIKINLTFGGRGMCSEIQEYTHAICYNKGAP